MNQSHILVKSLKKSLKARDISYRDLASKMDLSEASVKRIFSRGTFTLERLDQICDILGVDFLELAKMGASETREEIRVLTRTQEEALADDFKLYVVFTLLSGGLAPKSILKNYNISEAELNRAFLALDRLKLIELHAKGRVRLLVSKHVQWSKNGPLSKLYGPKIKDEFLASDFGGANERLAFQSAYLSEASRKTFAKKFEKLFAELAETSEIDAAADERAQRIWFLTAFRPWVFSEVRKLRRRG